jgi:molybdopterin molybdotransferase
MIPVSEARLRILARLTPTGIEIVPLGEAYGRVLAEDIRARLTNPPHDVSAMDGYAVRAADADPRRVIGATAAGHPFAGSVGPGEAVRLFTGSVMPQGADSVVIQEDITREGDSIVVRGETRLGQHIRRKGQDFVEGDVMVAANARLTPRHVGLIAAANHAWVAVRRRPVVAILATGDEIVLPGDKLSPGCIVSSNSHALVALVRACGGQPLLLPIAGDTIEAIAEAAGGARGADLLITTGGASVGEHDLVASALGSRGMNLDFWKIAMRPGKPLMHGRIGDLPMLGLPGNPVASYLCAVLFVKPAVERLLGLPGAAPTPISARVASDLPANDRRADHLRCRLIQQEDGTLRAELHGLQDSSMLRALAHSDGLILRAPHAPATPAGSLVEVLRLDAMGV